MNLDTIYINKEEENVNMNMNIMVNYFKKKIQNCKLLIMNVLMFFYLGLTYLILFYNHIILGLFQIKKNLKNRILLIIIG